MGLIGRFGPQPTVDAMSGIINIGNYLPAASASYANLGTAITAGATTEASGVDSVEISRAGRLLARTEDMSSYQIARLRAIRVEIEIGTFETPERLSGTVDRLLDVIG